MFSAYPIVQGQAGSEWKYLDPPENQAGRLAGELARHASQTLSDALFSVRWHTCRDLKPWMSTLRPRAIVNQQDLQRPCHVKIIKSIVRHSSL